MKILKAFSIIIFILLLAYGCGNSGVNSDDLTAEDYFNRGNVHRNNGEHTEAIEDYTKSIELNTDPAAYNNRGLSYAELGLYDEALQDYTKAIELNPNKPLYYDNRGRLYRFLEQYNNALQDYNKAIQLNPDWPVPYNNRGNIYKELEQYEEALQDYNIAIQLNPSKPLYYDNRGRIYRMLDQYDEALQDYNKAIQLDPTAPKYYNNRSYAYIGLNELDLALDSVNHALSLEPKAIYYDTRGDVYKAMGNTALMCQDYTTACNSGSEISCTKKTTEMCDMIPVGSTITITGPTLITDNSSSTSTDSVFFNIIVKNQNGDPLNDVIILISYPWAVPAPANLIQFYDGDTPKVSPMSVTTDSNGTYLLRMDYVRGGGVDYAGTLEVSSGSVIGTAEFSVSSESGSQTKK